MAAFSTVLVQRLLQIPRINAFCFSNFSTQYNFKRSRIDLRDKFCKISPAKRNISGILSKARGTGSGLSLKLGAGVRLESTASKRPDGEENIFLKFRKILYDFYLGGKELFKDVRSTFKIRRKLKKSDWNYEVLSRNELWTMFKTQRDLRKVLPIVGLSCLPVVGYLGPIIGFLRPRQFLCHHFWTAKQKKKFPALDDKERSVYRDILLKDINNQSKELEEADYELLRKLTGKAARNDFAPSNNDLIKILPIFSSGIFDLENQSRMHLKNLCSFWLLSSWLPNSFLRNRLKKETISIHKDDAAIDREGVDSLSEVELEEACHVRGQNTCNLSREELSKWLQDWVELSRRTSENETSFLAHQAVFKSVNFSRTPLETSSSGKRI